MEISFETAKKQLLNDELKTLHLYKFDIEQTKKILEIIKNNKSLKSLFFLNQPDIGLECGAQIADMLQSNLVLESIDMSHLEFNAHDFKSICAALAVNKSLTKLLFLHSKTGDIDPNSSLLAEAIKHNKALKELALYGNNINPAGAKNIANALRVNSTLLKLSLDRNSIQDEGVVDIADALCNNKNLKYLSLVGCKIGDAGASAIATMLVKNKKLQELVLWSNDITDKGVQEIVEALKINTSLKKIDLMKNAFGEMGKNALIDLKHYNKTLKEIRPKYPI